MKAECRLIIITEGLEEVISYPGELYSVTLEVPFTISGKYYPATRTQPAEEPELDMEEPKLLLLEDVDGEEFQPRGEVVEKIVSWVLSDKARCDKLEELCWETAIANQETDDVHDLGDR